MQNNSKDNKELNSQNPPVDCRNDINALRAELKEIRKSIDSMNTLIAAYNDSVTSFRQFVDAEKSVQTHCFTDIQAKLQSVNSSLSGIPQLVEGISKIEKIDDIEETVGNIDYNIRNAASSSENDEYKQMLGKKLSEYEEDLYKKLMRKYVIDTHISLFIQINEQIRNSESDNSLKAVLEMILAKLDAIGIKTSTSRPGDSFNPKFMTTGHYPNIETDNNELDGKVAESVSPMFSWNLPSIHQQTDSMVLREEEVILYQYSKKDNKNE